jgi:putative nucleotidyltransferase with HDIG domain
MRFADGGEAALVALATTPADVVVSDMRMPVMTGGELLAEIQRRWPATIRFILSGHADLVMVHRTIGATHQFLQKPCDAATIAAAVTRAWELHCTLSNQVLRLLVGSMQTLPSLPGPHARLLELLAATPADASAIAAVIGEDLGLSARVLQLVNSAFFGSRREVASPALAADLLGLDTLRSLTNSVHAFDRLTVRKQTWFDPDALGRHSLRVSRLAGRIAGDLGLAPAQIEAATTAGLLHDAGHLLLAAHRPVEYAALAQRILHEGDIHAERMLLGGSHGEIAAYLLGLWGLPQAVVEAVAWHHDPERGPATAGPLTCVHAADLIVNRLDGHPERNPPGRHLADLGLTGRIEGWTALA